MRFPLAIFQNLGLPEILIIGLVVLLVFGNRLPNVARSLGRSLTEFKKGLREDDAHPKTPPGGDPGSPPR
jgi:sec-independent protein translocase protein TatA